MERSCIGSQRSIEITRDIERIVTSTGKSSSRRAVIGWLAASAGLSILPRMAFTAQDHVARRFEFLSNNGNSSCSREFLDSISAMPGAARLQGSCCAPMVLHRYREQIAGLEAYATIAEIPPDPYDIEAGLAKRLLAAYDLDLTPDQQEAYDQAWCFHPRRGRAAASAGDGTFMAASDEVSSVTVVSVVRRSPGYGTSLMAAAVRTICIEPAN